MHPIKGACGSGPAQYNLHFILRVSLNMGKKGHEGERTEHSRYYTLINRVSVLSMGNEAVVAVSPTMPPVVYPPTIAPLPPITAVQVRITCCFIAHVNSVWDYVEG